MSDVVPGREFSASAVRGGGLEPRVGVVVTVESHPGAEWAATLSVEQAQQLIDRLSDALFLIEQEAMEAAAATRQ